MQWKMWQNDQQMWKQKGYQNLQQNEEQMLQRKKQKWTKSQNLQKGALLKFGQKLLDSDHNKHEGKTLDICNGRKGKNSTPLQMVHISFLLPSLTHSCDEAREMWRNLMPHKKQPCLLYMPWIYKKIINEIKSENEHERDAERTEQPIPETWSKFDKLQWNRYKIRLKRTHVNAK